MGKSKEYFLKIRQELFESEFTPMQRSFFNYCELLEVNEYETHKDDENYLKFYNAEKKAKKARKEYLFNKRHK